MHEPAPQQAPQSRAGVRRCLAVIIIAIWVEAAGVGFAQDGRDGGEALRLSTSDPVTPLPHFWETMFGSGRAILSLRQSYRQDLRAVKAVTGFRYVRFHNILHDEVGIVYRDRHVLRYNFSYVDQIYDGLLAEEIRPFVELSFMPAELSSNSASVHSFWYHPNVAPPKRYAQWDTLIRALIAHLVDRYGEDEVAQWYFEVWNEPNLDFWAGVPKQRSYFQLYAHTARDIKSVSPRLRVGGPATAQAAWIPEFLDFAHANALPVDFLSSHVYGNDPAPRVLGTAIPVSRERLVCRAARKLHDEIRASSRPDLPLIISEYNASYKNESPVTDSAFMGPWLASTIAQCDGVAASMSYWTFSDVFEEQGVPRSPFYGGFGLVAEHGIPKAAFNAFALLHQLGEQRIAVDSDSVLATKRADGSLAIALWNYAAPDALRSCAPKRFHLVIGGIDPASVVQVSTVDDDHGNALAAFAAMGSPAFPTRAQIEELRQAAALPPPEVHRLDHGGIDVSVQCHGLVLVDGRS
jgi:xylan 1,4-beta-xylosidase